MLGVGDLDQMARGRCRSGRLVARHDGEIAGPEHAAPLQRLGRARRALELQVTPQDACRKRRIGRRRVAPIEGRITVQHFDLIGSARRSRHDADRNERRKVDRRTGVLRRDRAAHEGRIGIAEAHARLLQISLEIEHGKGARHLGVAAGGGTSGMRVPERHHPKHENHADEADAEADENLDQREAAFRLRMELHGARPLT